MRITWMRVIIDGGVAVLLTGLVLLRLARPGTNAVIADRNSIQARLAIPKDLRQFPVEQYVGEKDWFVYRSVSYPSDSHGWQLYIVCADNDAEKWRLAFRGYLQERGKCVERGGDVTIAGQDLRFLMRQDSGGLGLIRLRNLSGRLQITFEYNTARGRSRIWRTKFGRYLAAVLLKVGLVDATTCES